MTEQELRERFTDHAGHYELSKRLDAMMVICKAYTDAQVAAKDAEIKRLREGIQKGFEKLTEIPYCSVLRTIFDNAKIVQNSLESLLSPAPVTEGKFSASAYPKECVPTIEQLTENDGMSMMERLEKRMPPFHRVEPVTEQCPDILQTILALPDDTSAAYIKSMIHDQLKRA